MRMMMRFVAPEAPPSCATKLRASRALPPALRKPVAHVRVGSAGVCHVPTRGFAAAAAGLVVAGTSLGAWLLDPEAPPQAPRPSVAVARRTALSLFIMILSS